jgi:hypothetical protein
MKLIFECPEKQKVFESAAFEVICNKGIAHDKMGNRFLDAKVVLNGPCPFCGEKHVYHTRELSCPFGSSESQENPIKENTRG